MTKKLRTLKLALALAATLTASERIGFAQDGALTVPNGLRTLNAAQLQNAQYLSYAHFAIPFDVDRSGNAPREIRLWVSPDLGSSWMMYGKATADQRNFEFQAAREGEYLFAVQAVDDRGAESLGGTQPMRIVIDTSKPTVELRTDVNAEGRLVVEYLINDPHLDLNSLKLSYAIDGGGRRPQINLADAVRSDIGYRGTTEIALPHCREVSVTVSASDYAQNVGEGTARYVMPRTASSGQGLQLAGHRGDVQAGASAAPNKSSVAFGQSRPSLPPTNNTASHQTTDSSGIEPIAGSQPWGQNPSRATLGSKASTSNVVSNRQADRGAPELTLDAQGEQPKPQYEELPVPQSVNSQPTESLDSNMSSSRSHLGSDSLNLEQAPMSDDASGIRVPDQSQGESALVAEPQPHDTYHCRSRSFSLDYSVDSLRGAAVSSIELWGTEDGGKTWQLWGTDPDRQSPFDVQVGNDGLFGFRMVVIGNNGLVSNKPNSGDSADMWIFVDTEKPTAKITRALYGEAGEAGALVIDYVCRDENLHDQPIKLSYAERKAGPWITIASAQPNNGSFRWKADPATPSLVYLKLEAYDRAGNMAEHVLDMPVDLRGLAPRGRIQGFRPIDPKPE